jgi:hypothetical protein
MALHRVRRGPRPPAITTRALLDQLAEGDPAEELSMAELLDRFSERSFGLFLLIVMLPTFIPIPIGMGGISGVLASLIGLQFLARLEHPWLPGFVARRGIHRHRLVGFRNRMAKVIGWIERLTKPRMLGMFDHPAAHAFTGLLLVILGLTLALPLPLTNYPFGIVLLAFAFALIERDGVLMLVAWGLGLVEIGIVIGFSSQVVSLISKLLH